MSDVLDAGPFFRGTKAELREVPRQPTRSYRSRDPLRVGGEVADWPRLSPEALQVWRDRLAAIPADGRGDIIN
jgi:hypothetical protein